MRSAKKTLVGAALIAASLIANVQTAIAEKSGLGLDKGPETITTPINPEGGANCLFTGHVMGKLTGGFVFTAGNAEITITEKPFLLPEAVLKSTLSVVLKDFCARFSSDGIT